MYVAGILKGRRSSTFTMEILCTCRIALSRLPTDTGCAFTLVVPLVRRALHSCGRRLQIAYQRSHAERGDDTKPNRLRTSI